LIPRHVPARRQRRARIDTARRNDNDGILDRQTRLILEILDVRQVDTSATDDRDRLPAAVDALLIDGMDVVNRGEVDGKNLVIAEATQKK
jgi:hypothetical protein